MASYNAEIAIAVKGGEDLKRLQNEIKRTAEAVDSANRDISAVANRTVSNLNTLSSALSDARNNFRAAARGTEPFESALKDLIKAEQSYNSELRERNKLLEQTRRQQGPSIRGERLTETQQKGRESLQAFFDDAAQQAKDISVAATNTRTAWTNFFDDAAQQARDISTTALNTRTSWTTFFTEASQQARDIRTTALNTRTSWETFFVDAGKQAKNIEITALNTRSSWSKFFTEAAEVANDLQKNANDLQKTTSIKALNVKQSWNSFFQEAEELAQELKQSSARVSLRAQERSIFVEETISKGRSARIARERSAFLQGSSGTERQGPLAGPGSLGFPVALPGLSDEELKGLQAAKDKLEIIKRTVKRRQELVNLAANLQKLDNNAKVAIADANRAEREKLKLKKKELELEAQINDTLAKKRKRNKEALGSAIIGGAFPLLFGQGLGASAGGAAGGGIGGLIGGQFGFGLSLVGTAIGQAFDDLNRSASETAAVIDTTVEALQRLQDKGFAVSDNTIEYIKTLEESGQALLAYNLVQKQLQDTYGNQGVRVLRQLDNANRDAAESGARLSAELETALAPAFIQLARLGGGAAEGLAKIIPILNLLLNPFKEIPTRASFKQARIEPAARDRAAQIQNTETLGSIEDQIASFERQNNIIQLGNKLTDQRVADAKELHLIANASVETAKLENEIIENIGDENKVALLKSKKEKVQAKLKLDLARLRLSVENAITQETQKRQRETEQRQRADAAAALQANNAQLKYLQDAFKLEEVLMGRTAAIELELSKLNDIGSLRKANFEIEKAAALAEAKKYGLTQTVLTTYNYIEESLNKQLQTQEQLLKKEKERIAQAQRAELRDLNLTGTSQIQQQQTGIRDLELQLANPFGGMQFEEQRMQLQQNQELLNMRNQATQQYASLLDKIAATEPGSKEEKHAKAMLKAQREINDALYAGVEQRHEVERSLLRQTQIINLMQPAIQGFSQGISDMVSGLIDGTQSVEESMAKMLKGIGQSFVQMAAEIIVQQTVMIALQALLKALGGPSFGGGESAPAPSVPAPKNGSAFQGIGSDLGGGVLNDPKGLFTPPTLMAARASGGPVNRNGTYMVGENGPELFRPTQAGRIDSNSDLRSAMSRQRSSAPAMNFSFETTNIGGTEYVSREQLEAAMAVTRKQAANDGAKRGMNMTLDKMQHSPATRRRVGI